MKVELREKLANVGLLAIALGLVLFLESFFIARSWPIYCALVSLAIGVTLFVTRPTHRS